MLHRTIELRTLLLMNALHVANAFYMIHNNNNNNNGLTVRKLTKYADKQRQYASLHFFHLFEERQRDREEEEEREREREREREGKEKDTFY